MFITSRRKILKTFASTASLAPFVFTGHSQENYLNTSNYAPGAIRTFHDWYCQNHFNFNQELSSVENDYIFKCFELMDRSGSFSYQINKNVHYSNISYSHRVRGSQINSSRIAAGSFLYPNQLPGIASTVMKHRQINLKNIQDFENIIGVGWDLENDHLKAYLFFKDLSKVKDSEVNDMISIYDQTDNQGNRFPFGLISITFKNRKIEEKKVYIVSKTTKNNEAFSSFITTKVFMITTERGVVPQYDLIPDSNIQKFLNESGKNIVQAYDQNLGLKMDTIAYQNSNNYTIYYP